MAEGGRMNSIDKHEMEDVIFELSMREGDSFHALTTSYMEDDREKHELTNCYDRPIKLYCMVVGMKHEDVPGYDWGIQIQHARQEAPRLRPPRRGTPYPSDSPTPGYPGQPEQSQYAWDPIRQYVTPTSGAWVEAPPGTAIPTNDLDFMAYSGGSQSAGEATSSN
jgi:hypothetical protein